MAAEKPSSKGQAWFCTTGLPSDVVIEVEDMTFHLHKFPLMSKSRKLHQLITEQETNPTSIVEREGEEQEPGGDEIEEAHCQISLPDFPGGSETFEAAVKFCYGVKVDLTSSTVAPLRCAGEFLEMTEEYSEDNLISRTERFLSQSVLKSLKESIKALKSCEKVMPLAESLGIAQRCIDSIASRASSTDPTLFGWPVSDGANENRATSNQALWNGIESAVRRKGAASASTAAAPVGRGTNADSWFEHLALLSLRLFQRLILAMRERDLSPDVIESCLMYYAKKHIPGISRLNRKPSSSSSTTSESEQRELLEKIVSNLPLEKSSRSSTTTRFLFGLLRTANILNASESCRSALEKKIGSQLEQATLDDLLIPSYSYLNETLYDVDCLERILSYFLDGMEERNTAVIEAEEDGDRNVRSPTFMLVGKLIDGYLAEIASDANLKPDRFYNLAISLPEQARLFDDGLYRAVDVYLKAHPWISEAEREKICGVMDCQKLTLEACTHAAQNERLPLRTVVQVLFFEQLQLRHAIAGTLIAADAAQQDSARPSLLRREQEGVEEGAVSAGATAAIEEAQDSSNTWRAAVRENQVLRLDMDSMRTRVHQLERECSTMKKVIEKIDKVNPRGWKRFGCKFKTQVCDSHEQTVVNARKGRHHHHQQ
ncbi:BTB/POZ domain-containing protein At5g66560 [Manihot esculenta]|uniref:NPH3 domain-containing protein n=1 Tax=Manihot esculenta TaxID=3983 RepID=A0A2C9UR91_MANES|nr:BTB/POZ domain-containing protein At5g66560 [Manihot esculenta]OAY33876.1 hypothetical protein MANES_13G132400v8 [Manihot esculenta]